MEVGVTFMSLFRHLSQFADKVSYFYDWYVI